MRRHTVAVGRPVIACLVAAAVIGAATGSWVVFGVTLAGLAAVALGPAGSGRGRRGA